MKKAITRVVAELPAMSRPELLKLWHELFGQPASEGMRRELLIPCLAYRLQEMPMEVARLNRKLNFDVLRNPLEQILVVA